MLEYWKIFQTYWKVKPNKYTNENINTECIYTNMLIFLNNFRHSISGQKNFQVLNVVKDLIYFNVLKMINKNLKFIIDVIPIFFN